MSDLATLGLRIQSDDVDLAEKRLNDLERTAGRTERATDGLSGGFGRAGTATGQMDEQLIKAVRSQDDVIRHTKSLGSALGNLAGDAAMGGASLDSMATNGGRAATSLLGLGARAVALTGVLGLVVVSVGMVAATWLEAEKSSLALERAATGLGRTAGLTGEELGNLASAAAEQGNVSIRSAKEQAAAYISTGKIGGEMISLLIADGKDLASFLGKDMPDAAKYLATSMGDPSKAAVEMTRQFGLLTQAQIKEIEKAQEAGDAYRAQKILMDALSGAAEGHAQNVDLMTSAWDRIGRSISNATHNFGEWLLVTDTEKLAKYDTAIANANRTGGQPQIIARMEQERQDLAFAIGYRNARRENTERSSAANQAAQARADAAGTPRTPRAGGASQADRDQANLIRQSQQLIEQMNEEAATFGMTAEALQRYTVARQVSAMAAGGWTVQETELATSLLDATDKLIARQREMTQVFDKPKDVTLDPINIRLPAVDETMPFRQMAEELRLIDQLARDAASGMASAFGEAGRSMGDMLTIMTDYQSRLADIALAVEERRLNETQGAREQAAAQIQSYGDMAGAAKGFFQEGSDGYRALQAVEAAYRAFQFAMSVQAMVQGAAETGASVVGAGIETVAVVGAETVKTGATVAGSAIRTPLKVAEGAASMFAALGPFAFPAVAAMIAILAALGMKGSKGGGGGGSSKSVDASVTSSQGYAAQQEQAKASFTSSLAQKVDVRVTADRDGIHAYVAETAGDVARPMVAQGMAATSGATRAQVMADLDKGRTYSRGAD